MKLAELFPLTEAVVKPWSKKALLSTTSYTEEELNKAADALIKYCPGFLPALKNGGILFRGDYDLDKFTYVDSSSGVRTSKDTNNFYQLMMEISEPLNNAGIPHRSKSLICSSSASTADYYGKISVVIPTSKASNIVVSGSSDTLESLIRYTGSAIPLIPKAIGLSQFGSFLTRFMRNVRTHNGESDGGLEGDSKISTIRGFEQELSKATIDIIVVSMSNALYSYFDQRQLSQQEDFDSFKKDFEPFVQKHHNNLLAALANEFLTPETLKLSTVSFGEHLQVNRECWVSGKAFLVPLDMFAQITRIIRERGHGVSYSLYQD